MNQSNNDGPFGPRYRQCRECGGPIIERTAKALLCWDCYRTRRRVGFKSVALQKTTSNEIEQWLEDNPDVFPSKAQFITWLWEKFRDAQNRRG